MDLLFWTYLINAVILINHEIDSAYWQEWKLIKPNDKNGINGFVILHFPMVFLVLLGLVLVYEHKLSGMIISLVLAASGIYAFIFHFYFIRKGRPEFNTLLSKGMLFATLLVSIFQIIITFLKMR